MAPGSSVLREDLLPACCDLVSSGPRDAWSSDMGGRANETAWPRGKESGEGFRVVGIDNDRRCEVVRDAVGVSEADSRCNTPIVSRGWSEQALSARASRVGTMLGGSSLLEERRRSDGSEETDLSVLMPIQRRQLCGLKKSVSYRSSFA